jgi:hypothetical protein
MLTETPGGGARKGQDREGGPWRIREQAGYCGTQETFYVASSSLVRWPMQTFLDQMPMTREKMIAPQIGAKTDRSTRRRLFHSPV